MTSAVEELLELLDAYSRHPRPHGQRVAGSPNGKSPNSNGLSSDIGSKRKKERKKEREKTEKKEKREKERERECVCVAKPQNNGVASCKEFAEESSRAPF